MQKTKRLFSILTVMVMAVCMITAMSVTVFASDSGSTASALFGKSWWWCVNTLISLLVIELLTIIVLSVLVIIKVKKLEAPNINSILPASFVSFFISYGKPIMCVIFLVLIIVSAIEIGLLFSILLGLKPIKTASEKAKEKESDEEEIYEPIIIEENVDSDELNKALAAPIVKLEKIDFVDEIDEESDNGVEIISVVWPERRHKNKLYRYAPNGEKFTVGDIVLVPTRDVMKNRDVIRKAIVVHGNHKIDPDNLHYELKKIIGLVKEIHVQPKSKK